MVGRAKHNGLRLAVETSVFVLLIAAWLWGIVALGAHATAPQGSASDGGGPSGGALVSCSAALEPEKEGAGSAAVAGEVCRPESRIHMGTSRQPGRGLASSGYARKPVERIPEKPLSGRSFGNNPSAHSGE